MQNKILDILNSENLTDFCYYVNDKYKFKFIDNNVKYNWKINNSAKDHSMIEIPIFIIEDNREDYLTHILISKHEDLCIKYFMYICKKYSQILVTKLDVIKEKENINDNNN